MFERRAKRQNANVEARVQLLQSMNKRGVVESAPRLIGIREQIGGDK